MNTAPKPASFTFLSAPDLMERLIAAQNAMACRGEQIDIVSFAGFCDSREELERHVARYEQPRAEAA